MQHSDRYSPENTKEMNDSKYSQGYLLRYNYLAGLDLAVITKVFKGRDNSFRYKIIWLTDPFECFFYDVSEIDDDRRFTLLARA